MYKKRLIVILLALAAILTVTACNAVLIGSGDVITETKQVSDFERISLEGLGEVRVDQGGSETLMVETYENVMGLVTAEVEGGTLILGLKEGSGIILPRRLIFHVAVDDLTGLAVAGSGGIEAETIRADHLDVSIGGSGKVQVSDLAVGGVKVGISGSGEIELGGEAADQEISIAGSGKYKAGEVCSASVMVNISGSGDATVCATETLDVDISGSGSVGYYGRPSINTSSSGSGRINNLGE